MKKKTTTFQAPLFRQYPLFIGFLWTPHLYVGFSSFTPSFLLKVTKFLNKIFQFEFNFVYKLFLLLNISDFGSIFFVKLATLPPLKKVIYFFPSNSLSKLRSCQALPFWKFCREFNSSQQKEGYAHYVDMLKKSEMFCLKVSDTT